MVGQWASEENAAASVGACSIFNRESACHRAWQVLIHSSDLCPYVCAGAGTGIVSLTIAALRHSLLEGAEDGESRIVTTDLGIYCLGRDILILQRMSDSAMPLLEHNISSNKHLYPAPSVSPQTATLDWNEDLPDLGVAGFDAIVYVRVFGCLKSEFTTISQNGRRDV